MVTSYVAVIIDYGFNRIKIGPISIGKIGLEFANVHTNSGFPLYDIYKLCGFMGESVMRKTDTPEVLDLINELFAYFGRGQHKGESKDEER
jgi:hypothetical protein